MSWPTEAVKQHALMVYHQDRDMPGERHRARWEACRDSLIEWGILPPNPEEETNAQD